MNTVIAMLLAAAVGQAQPGTEFAGEVAAGEAAAAEAAVEAGRDALEGGLFRERYPWYDSAADAERRIDVKTPWSWDWSWWDWLTGLFSGFDFDISLFGFSMSFFEVLLWLALLAMALGLVYLLTKVYLKKEQQDHGAGLAGAQEAEVDRMEALPEAARRHVADLLSEARRAYEQGRYGEAIVYLFSHQLLELDRHQVVRLAKGKTNRQYLREIGPRRPLRSLVEQTMVAFEDVFFGNHPLDRARFESCWVQLVQFDQMLTGGTA